MEHCEILLLQNIETNSKTEANKSTMATNSSNRNSPFYTLEFLIAIRKLFSMNSIVFMGAILGVIAYYLIGYYPIFSWGSIVGVVESIWQILALNPLFSGGAVLALFGAAGYYIRYVSNVIMEQLVNSVELMSDNVEFQWVIDFISQKSTWEHRSLTLESTLEKNDDEKDFIQRRYTPAKGTHYFFYQYRIIAVTKDIATDQNNYNSNITFDAFGNPVCTQRQVLRLTTIGGSASLWSNLFDEASKLGLYNRENKLIINSMENGSWAPIGKPRRKRPINSVVLKDGLVEKLVHDLGKFLNGANWYHGQGIPYRRGYLFHGPPGTGKTSIISALASHFGYSISVMSLCNPNLFDNQLNNLINNLNEKTFLVLEDVDVAFTSREDDEEDVGGHPTMPPPTTRFGRLGFNRQKKTCYITFSGLLNAIDGFTSAEGRIIFMTTNHRDKLDSALIRPGRIDVDEYFGYCTKEMTEKMFKRFYESKELCDKFIEAAFEPEMKEFTPAQLQRHFLLYNASPDDAIKYVEKLKE